MSRFGMLERTGANIGQQIGSGFSQFGQDMGGMLSGYARKRDQKKQTEEVQEMLAKYQNNPAQLNAMSAKYASEGNNALAKVFAQAAQRSVDKRAAQVSALEQAGTEATAKAQRSRAVQMALQAGDRQAAQAMRSGLLDPAEYVKNKMKSSEPKNVVMSPGSALVEEGTGRVIAERGFKPPAPKDPPQPNYKYLERDDGSVSVFRNGELMQTLPAPGASGGDNESGLMLIQQTNGLLNDIQKLKDIGYTESGFTGGVTSMIPGTPAYDREKDLLSLRARLGFDQINEMKRLAQESGASGTGLGQISNIEFMSLQSTIDAIYPGMSEEAQLEALENIERHLTIVQKLASGVAAQDAINWDTSEYKSRGYHQDPETKSVFYAPDGPSGKVYKLVDGKFTSIEMPR